MKKENQPAAIAPGQPAEDAAPVKAIITKPASAPPPPSAPLEDRLHRLNVLFALQGKYNRLCQSAEKLAGFSLKLDADRCSLTLRDDNGERFETNNAEVIADVVGFLKTRIAERKKLLEPS